MADLMDVTSTKASYKECSIQRRDTTLSIRAQDGIDKDLPADARKP